MERAAHDATPAIPGRTDGREHDVRREPVREPVGEPVREPSRTSRAIEIQRLEQLKEKLPPERREEISVYVGALKTLRTGRSLDAALLFKKYLDLYPEGILRDEAELSRLESLHASDAKDLFRTEARAWLDAHPKHHRRAEIEGLLRE